MEFTAQTPARSVDTGDYYSFNPNMVDDKGPNRSERRLMHGWATIGRPPEVAGVPYWEQAHSIPRVITIKDDRLWQEPIPELQSLRYDRQSGTHQVLSADKPVPQLSLRGDALEIIATFDRGAAKRCGLIVRANNRGEGTKIWVSAGDMFGIEGCGNTHFLKEDDPAVLHVFVDRGVIEVYCNGVAVTHKSFAPADGIGVMAFSEGGDAALKTLEAWKMKSMWE